MQHEIEQQFLDFDDFRPDALTRFPPSVGIEICVARGFDRNTGRMAAHHAIEHATQPSRMIRMGHEHDGSKIVLVAPSGKGANFIVGSFDWGDLHDVGHTKRSQLADLGRFPIFVGHPAADKLLAFFIWRVHKNRGSL